MTYRIEHKISGDHVGSTVVEADTSLHALCVYVEDYMPPGSMSPFVGARDGDAWMFRSMEHDLAARPVLEVAA